MPLLPLQYFNVSVPCKFVVDEETQIPNIVCAVDCCQLTFACWDCDGAGLWAMSVWASSCEAVEYCFSFAAVNGKTCSLKPGQALCESSSEAITHQAI